LIPKLSDNQASLELKKFNYGDIEFNYISHEYEFLVISDAWHPNWRAKINGKDVNILKTNGVFKGLLVPPGEGIIHLFFDNSSYYLGVWISLSAWSLFFLGWGWCSSRIKNRY
jgi:uncharacterized membrane protein YfhO